MFLCQVELLSYLNPASSPRYLVLATYGFDPGLQVEEETWIAGWEVWGKTHNLKVKVVERKKELFPDGNEWLRKIAKTRQENIQKTLPIVYNALSEGSSLFLLRIFVEAEDRDRILAICDDIAANTQRLKEQGLLY